MTTLLISDIFPPKTGGSSRWFWEIYRRLPRQDFVIAAGEDARQESFDAGHDLRVRRLPLRLAAWGLKGWRGYWRAVRNLRRVIAEEGVDRVHCGRCLPEGVIGLALKCRLGLPYVCYVHGEDVTTASTSRELSWLVRRVLHRSDYVIANSRNTEQLLRADWSMPAEQLRLLHPGVDTGQFVPAPRDTESRARLGWGERPVLLTVGRLQKRKGHDQMILALQKLRGRIPDVLYAVIGDGEERETLQQLVGREGLGEHVQFLGEVSDALLVTAYQQCDLFVLPNRTVGKDIEGFGMVLLEAQACGKGVVAGDSGGTAETMRVPETGRIAACDTPGPLADLVGQLLADRDLLGRMGEAARSWVVERFDWEVLTRQARHLFLGPPERDAPAVIGLTHHS